MNVLLIQIDGRMPNLALMRISAHHKAAGDQVELRQVRSPHVIDPGVVERGLWDRFDRVYASLIFEKSRPIAERLRQVYPDAMIGGTGWDLGVTLEDVGITTQETDYSLWPSFRSSLGFTQRGCRLECPFCVVPRKEGRIREVATIAQIWRGEPWPRQILLLDNDFFGQPSWPARIAELRAGRFKVSFNQGINARMLSEEAAAAIASVDYRDDGMVSKCIYTAWDNRGDERVLFRGLQALTRHGVRPDYIVVYMLIGYWAGETEEDWLYRHRKLREFGARPYPMVFGKNRLAQGFQRWCVRRNDFKVSWEEYKRAKCQPEVVKRQAGAGRLPLFLEQ